MIKKRKKAISELRSENLSQFQIKDVYRKMAVHNPLNQLEIGGIISGIKDGTISDNQIGAFLMGSVTNGLTNTEIGYIATSMQKAAIPIRPNITEPLIDVCGTGGGDITTFNISTANSLVAAAGGVYVAKHGSRSISSKSGGADVLEALGVKIDLRPRQIEKLIKTVGISFLYANNLHPVMGRVYGLELELGIKSIFFTLIGPLINPAGTKRHVLGVYQSELVDKMADVANKIGFKHALIVHGVDGMDEISPVGETMIAEVKDGKVETYTITPEQFGMKRGKPEEISGDSPVYNAKVIRDVLTGREMGIKRNAVVLNAGASFYVARKVDNLGDGVRMAAEVIDSGKAAQKLDELIERSNSV